jgi:NAD(P)-dependent dehydrogenase (short-subunit alcohol dehydrogenase family)
MAKCEEAAAKISKENKVDSSLLIPIQLDLSSLKNTASFAENFLKRETRLDSLVLNAGISMGPFELTEDGIEKSMCVCVCVCVYFCMYVCLCACAQIMRICLKREERLDSLVLNAGISMGPFELTEEGIEKSMYVCVCMSVCMRLSRTA